MITVYDAHNYAQQWLFQKAYAALDAKQLLREEERNPQKTFLSLDGYFAHMHDLITISPNYVLLPADEKPFEINANTRAISVPADFSKCAGVVGDDMCEIVTFTIDRYFDYTDLANANICIQWTCPTGEGISHIGLVDLDTIPGKIRFGWPLTGELTEKAGNITFAVRFFIKDDSNKFVYLFNTLTTTIPIRPGLDITNPDVEEKNVADLFEKFVANSNNPSYPIPQPVFFVTPGLDLVEQAAIDPETDTLVLKGQAVVADNGHIIYRWHFKEGDSDTAEVFTPESTDERFKVEEIFELIEPRPTKRIGSEQYFEKVTNDEGAEAYALVVSKDLPDVDLYERFTTLTILAETGREDITGDYWIGAVNKVGATTVDVDGTDGDEVIPAMNATPEKESTVCKVPTPIDIVIPEDKDLAPDIFIDTKSNEAILTIDTTPDAGNPIRTYSWYRNLDSNEVVMDEDHLVDSGVDMKNISTMIPGWYQAHVNSLLNRKNKTEDSKVARVINDVAAPVLQTMSYAKWTDSAELDPETYFADAANWTVIYDYSDPDAVLDMGESVAQRGDIVRLRVTTDLDEAIRGGLLTDEITYTWHVIEPDVEARPLEIDDVDLEGNGFVPSGDNYKQLGGNEIDIRCLENNRKCEFFCVVNNTLSDREKALEQGAYPAMFIVW